MIGRGGKSVMLEGAVLFFVFCLAFVLFPCFFLCKSGLGREKVGVFLAS